MCYLACKFQIAPTFSISGRKNVFINLHNILYPYCCSNHVVYGFDVKPPKQHDLNIYFYEFQLQWFAKSWGGWPSTKIWFMFLLRFNLKIEGGKIWIENARMYINFFRTSSKVHCEPKQQDSYIFIFYEFTSSDLQIFYMLA